MNILFADNFLIVIDKPVGQSSEEALSLIRKDLSSAARLVHRIDQPVSGIVVLATGKESAATLSWQLSCGDFARRYIGVCQRNKEAAPGEWKDTIVFNHKTNYSTIEAPGKTKTNGKQALLKGSRLGQTRSYDAWEFNLVTGRHHQIRAQCSHRGIPVVGDLKYGAKRSRPGGGIYLHAISVRLIHPASQQEISFFSVPEMDLLWEHAISLYQSARIESR